MGKTSKPLRILVLPPLDEWEEFKTLEAQGHQVVWGWPPKIACRMCVTAAAGGPCTCLPLSSIPATFDLFIGGPAWHMTDAERRYLPLAIKAARKRRYPKEPDDAGA